MTASGGGPPENDAAREVHHTYPGTSVKGITKTQTRRHQPSLKTRPACYATAWRDGFGCGFRDALRLAARELPPETWATLDSLASRYELAGTDV